MLGTEQYCLPHIQMFALDRIFLRFKVMINFWLPLAKKIPSDLLNKHTTTKTQQNKKTHAQ